MYMLLFQDSYKLIIRAQDLGSPPNSNTTQVIVNVQDVNDNSPRFPSANYYQSVAEDVPEGYSILQVTAFDPDQVRERVHSSGISSIIS